MASQDKEENSFFNSQSTILVLGVLLGSLIISASILMAGNVIGDKVASKLTGNVVLNGTGTGDTNPTPTGDTGNQPSPTIQLSELMDNTAGSLGSENAPIVIIEYSDYQCPFCRTWVEASKAQLQREYIDTGKVRLIWKDFPLNFHPMAETYSNAARCAGEQGKYWQMHDTIFSEQGKKGQGTITDITVSDIKQWGSNLGLNTTQFNSCVDTDKYAAEIQDNTREGTSVGVGGTPSFVIGKSNGTGQLIVGAQPYSTFKAAIDALQ